MKKLLAVTAFALFISGCNPQAAHTAAPATPGGKSAAAHEFKVVNMSPRSTKAGAPFNVQVDNGSGVSFELNQPVPAGDVQVTFDGKPLGGVAANGVIVTATIPNDYIAKMGRYPVTMQVAGSAVLPAGEFTVE